MSDTKGSWRSSANARATRASGVQASYGVRRIGVGPSRPCSAPEKSKSLSSLRKYGSTSFQAQPRAPSASHSS